MLTPKNLFSVISNVKSGPSTKTLCPLFKSLVRSKIDYGLIAYGSASKTAISRIDVAARSIIRLIMGSRKSTPMAVLYADLSVEPTKFRRQWLATRFLLKLSCLNNNSAYAAIHNLDQSSTVWPQRSIPALWPDVLRLQLLGIPLFISQPGWNRPPASFIPPWDPPPCRLLFFPLDKKQASANRYIASQLFNTLASQIPCSKIVAYSDGSVSPSADSTSCAVVKCKYIIHGLHILFLCTQK